MRLARRNGSQAMNTRPRRRRLDGARPPARIDFPQLPNRINRHLSEPAAARRYVLVVAPQRHPSTVLYDSAQVRECAATREQVIPHCDRPRQGAKWPVCRVFERALCRTRTDDPFLTMEVLYQLS